MRPDTCGLPVSGGCTDAPARCVICHLGKPDQHIPWQHNTPPAPLSTSSQCTGFDQVRLHISGAYLNLLPITPPPSTRQAQTGRHKSKEPCRVADFPINLADFRPCCSRSSAQRPCQTRPTSASNTSTRRCSSDTVKAYFASPERCGTRGFSESLEAERTRTKTRGFARFLRTCNIRFERKTRRFTASRSDLKNTIYPMISGEKRS